MWSPSPSRRNRSFMKRYRSLRSVGVDVLNREIGRAVKDKLNHKTDIGINEEPRSALIQRHTMHKP